MVMNIIDVEVNKRLVEELRQCREQLAAEAAEAALIPLRRVAEAAREAKEVGFRNGDWKHDMRDALAALDAAQGQEERDDGRES